MSLSSIYRKQVISSLRQKLRKGEHPFLLSLICSEGNVYRDICTTELDVERLLDKSGLGSLKKDDSGGLLSSPQRLGTLRMWVRNSQGVQERIDLIIEEIIPTMRIIVFGAGHVGKAVGQIASQIGWEIIIIDDRFEFLDRIGIIEGNITKVNQSFDDRNKEGRDN